MPHAKLKSLAQRRWRIAITLSIAVAVIYFGFVLLVAFDKPLMGAVIVPGLSLGIASGCARHRRGVGNDMDLCALGERALRHGA